MEQKGNIKVELEQNIDTQEFRNKYEILKIKEKEIENRIQELKEKK